MPLVVNSLIRKVITMKVHTSLLGVVISLMASSFASAGEVTECTFKDHHRDDVRCTVHVVEKGRGGFLESTTPPMPPRDDCDKVKIYVDCDCDFKLNDEYATQFK